MNFNSTDDQRVDNNPILPEEYNGPDDVSLRYSVLSEDDKKKMGLIKMLAQKLINEIRDIDPGKMSYVIDNNVVKNCESRNRLLEIAVDHARYASMLAVKVITGPK